MHTENKPTLLRTPEAARLLGLRPNTLEIWRVSGRGPAYHKVGRAVRYVEAELLEWLAGSRFLNTSEYSLSTGSLQQGREVAQ